MVIRIVSGGDIDPHQGRKHSGDTLTIGLVAGNAVRAVYALTAPHQLIQGPFPVSGAGCGISGGKFRFNLKASNGQVIGVSQNYDSESGRDNGIGSVARNAPDAAAPGPGRNRRSISSR